jgi:uncharacterized phiE125 gp8 family phage protein
MAHYTSLKLIIPPIIEPVTVEEVKIYTHIDHDVDDKLIAQWIKTARILAENFQNRAYYEQTWELSFDSFPTLPLQFPRPPLARVDFIKYYDCANILTTLNINDFIIDTNREPGRITHTYLSSWPSTTLRTIDAVRIRYTCGFECMYSTDSTTPETGERWTWTSSGDMNILTVMTPAFCVTSMTLPSAGESTIPSPAGCSLSGSLKK